jgi:hypothetical protein
MSRIVHHENCTMSETVNDHFCSCPWSWPRREEDVKVKHVRGGNCWVGVRQGDVCASHDEPRGECHECPPCPACSLPDVPRIHGEVP